MLKAEAKIPVLFFHSSNSKFLTISYYLNLFEKLSLHTQVAKGLNTKWCCHLQSYNIKQTMSTYFYNVKHQIDK